MATHVKECSDSVRGECAERMDALEQRLETEEEDQREMKATLSQVATDVSYMRGRFDAMIAMPPPQIAKSPRRHRQLAVNLTLGGIGAAVVEILSRMTHK